MACMEMHEIENSSDELREEIKIYNKTSLWRKQWLKTFLLTLAVSLLSALFIFTVTYFTVCVTEDKVRCEASWELYNNHCYKFVKEKEERKSAQEKCSDECASLVKIDDAVENVFINSSGGLPYTKVPGEWYGNVFWTSGIRDGGNKWKWSTDGKPLTYDNFDSKEPNNIDGSENCITVKNDGTWNDSSCIRLLYYICEKQARK